MGSWRVGWAGGAQGETGSLRGVVCVALLTCAVTKHVGSRQRAGLDSKPLVQRREPHLEWALPQLLCAPGQSMLLSGLSLLSSPGWARRSLRSLSPPCAQMFLASGCGFLPLALRAEALSWRAAACSWHVVVGCLPGGWEAGVWSKGFAKEDPGGPGGHGEPQTPPCPLPSMSLCLELGTSLEGSSLCPEVGMGLFLARWV